MDETEEMFLGRGENRNIVIADVSKRTEVSIDHDEGWIWGEDWHQNWKLFYPFFILFKPHIPYVHMT